MSDEKKPFAEVVTSDLHGRPVLSWPGGTFDPDDWHARMTADLASLRNAARRISEAVEQREAKLRGALRTLIDSASRFGSVPGAPSHRDHILVDKAVAAARDALAGTGPDYVPRAELDAEKAKLTQISKALEVLDTRREDLAAREVCAWLEESGLKKPTGAALRTLKAEALFDELRRRGVIATVPRLRQQYGDFDY